MGFPRKMGWAASGALALAACMVAPESAPLQDDPPDARPLVAPSPSPSAASPKPSPVATPAASPSPSVTPSPSPSPSRKPGEMTGTVSTLEEKLDSPYAVAVAPDGTLYALDGAGKSRLLKFTPDGKAKEVPLKEDLDGPHGLLVTSDGTIYIADTGNRRVVKRAEDGKLTVLADPSTEGLAPAKGGAEQFSPWGLAIDADGVLFVTDVGNHTVVRLVEGEPAQVVAGTGEAGQADGAGAEAQFDGPHGLAFNPKGDLVVADFNNNAVRVLKGGTVSTFDISAPNLAGPSGLAIDKQGTLYVSGTRGHLVYRIGEKGQTDVLVGRVTGMGDLADGVGYLARFSEPEGLAMAPDWTLYVADRGNGRIRKIQ